MKVAFREAGMIRERTRAFLGLQGCGILSALF